MTEAVRAPSWDGSVVLDIGGDIGALILHTSSSCAGREIDLIPDDDGGPCVHSAVRERRSADGSSFAAVYPQLKDGGYRIEGTYQHLVIEGGRVVELHFDESSHR